MIEFWENPSNLISSEFPSTNPYGNFTLVDTVPREILHMVDTHWYQFPPMNPLWYKLIGFWMLVMGILALTGNSVVIWIFMKTKSLRTPSNWFVINLALSDFSMMFFMCPPILMNCYNQTWSFTPFFCQMYAFLGSLFGGVSIWSMVFICIDRYNVIVKGMATTRLTTKGVMLRIIFVWLNGILWCVPPLLGFNRYVPEGNMTACGTDYLTNELYSHVYLYLYTFFVYFVPLFITIYCYTFILKAVAKHEQLMHEQAKKMGVKSLRSDPEAKRFSSESRLAKVAIVTVSLWFIAWTPYCIINIAGMVYKPMVTPLFSIWGSVFAKANAVYNPIVYAISHPKYRQAIEMKLPYLSCASDHDNDDSMAESMATKEKS